MPITISPDRVADTNFGNIFDDEYIKTTEGERVEGPMKGVRISEYPDLGLIVIQHRNRRYEVSGKTFEEAVHKR